MCKTIIGQANINAQELQKIPIALPPLALQDEFAAFVEEAGKSKFVGLKQKKSFEYFTSGVPDAIMPQNRVDP
jgi:type I restriction enzyme S subunit